VQASTQVCELLKEAAGGLPLLSCGLLRDFHGIFQTRRKKRNNHEAFSSDKSSGTHSNISGGERRIYDDERPKSPAPPSAADMAATAAHEVEMKETVLVVGDGNFSFSRALAANIAKHRSRASSGLTATSLDSREALLVSTQTSQLSIPS